MVAKLRIFVIDKKSGHPRANIPIGLIAELQAEDQAGIAITRDITIGIVQSDHVGYASIEVMEASDLSHANHIWLYPLADKESRIDVKPTISLRIDPTIINLPIPNTIESDPFRRFPAIPTPDATDRQISPRSFARQPELKLGQGTCEEFHLNAIAERTFRFSQIVFDSNQEEKSLNPVEPINEFEDSTTGPIHYRMGALLEYTMQWLPLGHALGEIVYSLPLAPCESINLAVIEWARQDSAARTEGIELREELIHNQRRDRIIEETVSATLREWQRGGSILGGGSIAGSLGGGLAGALALGGGYSTTSGDRDINAETVQTIADSVSQATTAVRSMFSTVIVQASQAERDVIETRTVTNHNHCHALTILYYELLRQYRVVTRLAKGTDVVLIKKPHQDFTVETALCSRPFLESALLEPRLQACFEALVRIHYEEIPAPEEPRVQNIRRLIAHVTTGNEAAGAPFGTSDIQLIIQRTDGTESGPWKLKGDFEENEVDTTTIELDSAIALETVRRVGIEFTSHGDDDWEMKRLRIEYALEEPAGVHLLYDSDTDSDATPPLPHEFEADSHWWGSPLSFEVPDEGPGPAELQRKSDEACAKHLIAHLNCHKTYYWRVIWMSQDPGVYAKKFDRYPYPPGSSSGRLLDHIELRPVAVIGEYIAFPLNTSTFAKELLQESSIEPLEQFTSLPTRGVFAEAKLSNCCACEERDVTKFWDWSESPCPEKTPEITAIAPGSRARDIESTPSDMPTPVVNIVNPPAVPDPTGMANALNLLATSNIFRDMSSREEVSALLQKLADVAGDLAKADLFSGDGEFSGSGGSSDSGRRSGSSSSGSTSTGRASGTTGLDARETHDRIQVARNAMRGGNISKESGNSLISDLTDAMVPQSEPEDLLQPVVFEVEEDPSLGWVHLGFTSECLANAAAAVNVEEIANALRGPMLDDGVSRNTTEGIYYQLNIPDQAAPGGASWRSWDTAHPPTPDELATSGIGGGWFISDTAGQRWIDFYRRPHRSAGEPLVWQLIRYLADPWNALLVVEQLVRVARQPSGVFLDPALTLVNAYREFGAGMFPNARAVHSTLDTYSQGGLDQLGTELSRMKRQGFLRNDIEARVLPCRENERGGRACPASLARGSVIEAMGATLAYKLAGERQVLQLARRGELLGIEETGSLRATRLWTNARFSEPGTIACMLLPSADSWRPHGCTHEWPSGLPHDFEQIIGWDAPDLIPGDPRRRVVFKRAHISTGEAELLDRLVIDIARDSCESAPPTLDEGVDIA